MPNKSWFSIKASANNTAEILIYDEIGYWGVRAKDFASALKELNGIQQITLRINSPGGSVFNGAAIYNLLKSHSATIRVKIDGLAASMASVIAMAGDIIEMPENALMMIHNPWTYASGDADELRKSADVLDKIKKSILAAYAKKTGLSDDEISAMMDAETWLTGAEAAALGFVDDLTAAVEVENSFDLSQFNNVPQAIQKPIQPLSAVADTPRKPTEVLDMPKPNEPATPEKQPLDAAKIADDARAKAEAAAAARINGINEVFAEFPAHHALAMSCIVDKTCTVEQAQARLLKKLGETEEPIARGSVFVTDTGSEKFRADAVDAIIARAGRGSADSSNQLRGYTARELARVCAERAGVRTEGMDPRNIVAAAFTQTGSDFPVLLENTMHKVLQGAYDTTADTWRRFCAIGSVSDFRAHNRYRIGSIGNLDSLLDGGEFKNKAIPDGEKSVISASTKGNLINLTRQTIIDDDLGVFISLAAMLGRATARTIETDVYALLAENSGLGPILLDGKTLFHADHGNIGAGAALSVASLDADRVLMASQKDVSDNDFLDLRPDALLLPIGLGGDARVIVGAEYDPDTSGKLQRPNKVRGLVKDIIDTARLSGTRRYMFANPSEAPVIEVAFLDGNQSPFLDSQNGFTVDGVQWKVRIDYGMAGIDYRGAVTNAGA